MADTSKIYLDIPGLKTKVATLKKSAEDFVEKSAFKDNANGTKIAETACKGAAYRALCTNDVKTYNALKSWRNLVNALAGLLESNAMEFEQAENI